MMAFQYPKDFPIECDGLNHEHENIVKLVNMLETMVNDGANKSDIHSIYCNISVIAHLGCGHINLALGG